MARDVRAPFTYYDMNKILHMGKSCKSYLKLHGQKQPELVFTCENDACMSRILHKHGRYFRTAVTKTFRIPIYRWYCPECGQTLSVLPDFLVPGSHFVTSVREAALKRKEQGAGFASVAAGVVSAPAGSVSPKTVKRWWNRHMRRSGDAAQWIAGELIRAGVGEDLLRQHFYGVNPTAVDTVRWLALLARTYIGVLRTDVSLAAGVFRILNTKLPFQLWV